MVDCGLSKHTRNAGNMLNYVSNCIVMKLIPNICNIPSLPGCQTLLSPSSSEPDTSLSRASSKGALKSDDVGDEGEAVDGKLSIFIHKREDQSSHEVLQPLLR